MISDDYMHDHVRAMEDRIEELEDVRDELIAENERFSEARDEAEAFCELLADALDDACEHMSAWDVARMRKRHPEAMGVIA